MSARSSNFLKDLPSRNKDNFTKVNGDSGIRPSGFGRKNFYLEVRETTDAQLIVTEKTNILLRFLHQQWDKKNNRSGSPKKRMVSGNEEIPNKRIKLESLVIDAANPLSSAGSGGSAEQEPSASGAGPSSSTTSGSRLRS